ncbi:MAG: SRPBCC family protein [Pirellula sp.]|jgi:ribosome-associated toxin RatA of RatAB toxin-antitoxin module
MKPIFATDERILPFEREKVWHVLANVAVYADWWPRSVGLRVLHAAPEIIGSSLPLRPLGGRAFRCRIESLESPNAMRMKYFGGFIEGQGEWRLEALGSETRVQFELDVQAVGRFVACLAKRLPLNRFHSYQMKQVLRNLERKVCRTHLHPLK